MKQGVGVLEIGTLGAALVVLDHVDKAAPIRLLQAELNDYYGYVIKILGDPASLRSAIDLEKLGPRTLWIDCDVLQADGGTRAAGVSSDDQVIGPGFGDAGSDGPNKFGPAPGPNSLGVLIVGWAMPVIMLLGIAAAVLIPQFAGMGP